MTCALSHDDDLPRVLEAIYVNYHYDFRDYSPSALRRRLHSKLGELSCKDLRELATRLPRERELFPRLLDALTVQVSDMFRDPSYFRMLRERIVPVLSTYPSLRIWVAGCAGGEEAYSMAILLREAGLLERSMIYATDINPEALRRAEAGVYPSARAPTFTQNHQLSGGPCSLSRYYTASYDAIVVDRSLRRHMVFSDHSLSTDAVFAEVQLVSCRNVLIYFEPELQERSLALFKDSLCRKGFLGLGSHEGPRFRDFRRDFQQLEVTEPWYQRKGTLP